MRLWASKACALLSNSVRFTLLRGFRAHTARGLRGCMNPDPNLIDAIKTHFARKSSAQLQEIVQANDPERWSPEAVAAAGEVLLDRMAGRASEPEVAEEERPPPPPPPDPYSLAFLALGALAGL